MIWEDIEGNYPPILLDLPNNLWGRDLLEDMELVVTTNNKAFYNDCTVRDKLGMKGCPQF